MNKFLETIMNFINENTPLLIIICVFLIFVLIGYLIDNSIKTRKMEKQMLQGNTDDILDNPVEPVKEVPVVNEPVLEPTPTAPIEPEVAEIKVEEPVIEEPTTPIEEPVIEEPKTTDINTSDNQITVDEKINDLLLRDFSSNGMKTVDISKTEENIVPIENVIETPVVKEESVYKNDKKLSDIFKKKEPKVEEKEPNLEKTVDFSNELDRILKKLNDDNYTSKDSTLDETTDFSNMF